MAGTPVEAQVTVCGSGFLRFKGKNESEWRMDAKNIELILQLHRRMGG